ncbi:DegT/DnrJ/EryC1/StrS family aminotransferase [bacterium SCSIO 12741]|nr:DegT/DnrJ/EryC1/StrS family aminotransferase [bacterium SCSIO 12741]
MTQVPFSPPRMDQKMTDAVVEVLNSGWITTGPKTKLFEERLAEYTGAPRVVCFNSATAGLELALRWFGIGEGDEVILPAYTYSATGNVILHCGARPVFVDIGDDFNISLEAIKAAITPRTKAIMPVDIGGWPCDYDGINELIREPGVRGMFSPSNEVQETLGRVLLLSDSAHSVGAWYKGKRSGSLADFSAFSFHAVKNLCTAEGGALTLNLPEPFDNDEIYKQLRIKSLHGQTKDALAKTKAGGWRYDIVEPGFKCNMTDIQAALGLVELERYDSDMLAKRKYIFDRYSAGFSSEPWAQLPIYESEESKGSYHIFMLRIKDATEGQRDQIIDAITEKQVAVNVHFQPLPMFTAYRERGYSIDPYPNAFAQYACEITLPVFYDISDEQIDAVIDAVKSAVQKVMG